MADARSYGTDPAQRQDHIRRIAVEHDRYERAFQGLTDFHHPVRGGRAAVGSLSMLIGDSRTGKSFVCGRYAAAHPTRVGPTGLEMPIVRVDMPIEYSGSARGILTGIADALEFPAPGRLSNDALSILVLKSLKERKVELLILDEFEQLFQERNRRLVGFGKGLIRKMLNMGTLSIVCVGLTETYDLLMNDEQLVGRGGLPYRHLSPYSWEDVNDRKTFRAICHAFDKELPFEERSGLGETDMYHRLYWVSQGNIGKLKWLLEAASAHAINDNALSVYARHFEHAFDDRIQIGTSFNPFRHDMSRAPSVDKHPRQSRAKPGTASDIFLKSRKHAVLDGV